MNRDVRFTVTDDLAPLSAIDPGAIRQAGAWRQACSPSLAAELRQVGVQPEDDGAGNPMLSLAVLVNWLVKSAVRRLAREVEEPVAQTWMGKKIEYVDKISIPGHDDNPDNIDPTGNPVPSPGGPPHDAGSVDVTTNGIDTSNFLDMGIASSDRPVVYHDSTIVIPSVVDPETGELLL